MTMRKNREAKAGLVDKLKAETIVANAITEERLLAFVRRNRATTTSIVNHFGSTKRKVERMVRIMQDRGVLIYRFGDQWGIDKSPPRSPVFEYVSRPDNTYLFGFSSDQHLASKYSRLDVLGDLYNRFADQGVDRVFNAGNWIDGESRFNMHDLFVHGMDNQIEYMIENYPQRTGIVTYAVAGDDHEGWYSQREGIDIGRHAERMMQSANRTDWVHLGYMEAFLSLRNANTNKTGQLLLMHPGGGSAYATCFDDTAEILTRSRGWLKFSDLEMTDEVATMTKVGHVFEWQCPTVITKEPYCGEMVRFKSRCLDFAVTPNHRLWVQHQRSAKIREHQTVPLTYPQKARVQCRRGWHAKTAEDLCGEYSRQKWAIPSVARDWIGVKTSTIKIPPWMLKCPRNKRNATQLQHLDTISIEDAAELIAWYVTEGSLSKNGKHVEISQYRYANHDNWLQIQRLFTRLRLRFKASDRSIGVGSVQLSAWLRNQCGCYSDQKYLPMWLKDQPRDVLQIVFDTMINGDGWVNGSGYGYKSISQRLRSDFTEICAKLGWATTEHRDTVTVRKIQVEPTINSVPTREPYNGIVYCCSVPNELIFVRSNGRAFFSHNSYRPQKIIEGFSGGEKPAVLLIGHYHKLSMNLIRNVWAIQIGTSQDQTIFMRKKGIEAHVGGGICRLEQDPDTGAIIGCRVELLQYFNSGYYNNRWNPGGAVVHPDHRLNH